MLIIRNSQKNQFDAQAMRRFEDRTLARLRQYFPKHCAAVNNDEPLLRRIIQTGYDKAQHYDLTFESGAVLIIDMMFLFGSSFDSDPQYPWAIQWLTYSKPMDQHIKIDAIYQDAMDCAKGIFGPDNRYLKKTLQTILRRRNEDPPFIPPERLPAFLQQTLQALYPEKCRYIGEIALQQLVVSAFEATKRLQITATGGIIVYSVAALILGYRFENDPLFPWAEKIFSRKDMNGENKIATFQQEAYTYLEKWCSEAA